LKNNLSIKSCIKTNKDPLRALLGPSFVAFGAARCYQENTKGKHRFFARRTCFVLSPACGDSGSKDRFLIRSPALKGCILPKIRQGSEYDIREDPRFWCGE
jgi:hypothetical protein